MTGCDSVMFQSGRAARGSAFLLTRTVCPTTSHLVQRTPILHDTGAEIFRVVVMVMVLLFKNCVLGAVRKITPGISQLVLPGLPQSTPQVRPTPQICRTSSTASSKEHLPTTWLPTGASSPQVPPITRSLVRECPLSPLPRARPASTCQEATGLRPASRGPKAASLPEGGRKSVNPSRGEACGHKK